MSAKGSGHMNASSLVALVSGLFVFAVCWNLSQLQSKMDERILQDERNPRHRLVEGIVSAMKKMVKSKVNNRADAMGDAVKKQLEHDIADALSLELHSAMSSIEAELSRKYGSASASKRSTENPKAKAVKTELKFSKGGSMEIGLEDLDEAVEKRALELAMEEKLNPSFRPGYFITAWRTTPPWPFQLILDRNGKDTGVVGLAAPFIKYFWNAETERSLFWRLKADGHIMLGITSYEWFPGNATNPFTDRPSQYNPEDKKIYAAMDAFAHCFKQPHLHIPPGVPRALISQSDFTDPNSVDLIPKGLPKAHAFIYSNLAGEWNDFNRNWTLAKACIKRAAEKGMKSILIGKQADAGKEGRLDSLKPEIDRGIVQLRPMLPHMELADLMEQSEFFFIPNLSDASPRVAAEALSRNIPLVMNRHIAGGWKYINEQTGVFFDGEEDFLPAVQRLRELRDAQKLQPRDWFRNNYGPRISSLRLQAFLELVAGQERLKQAKNLARKW